VVPEQNAIKCLGSGYKIVSGAGASAAGENLNKTPSFETAPATPLGTPRRDAIKRRWAERWPYNSVIATITAMMPAIQGHIVPPMLSP
jgi:hypothetical protein